MLDLSSAKVVCFIVSSQILIIYIRDQNLIYDFPCSCYGATDNCDCRRSTTRMHTVSASRCLSGRAIPTSRISTAWLYRYTAPKLRMSTVSTNLRISFKPCRMVIFKSISLFVQLLYVITLCSQVSVQMTVTQTDVPK